SGMALARNGGMPAPATRMSFPWRRIFVQGGLVPRWVSVRVRRRHFPGLQRSDAGWAAIGEEFHSDAVRKRGVNPPADRLSVVGENFHHRLVHEDPQFQ